MFVFIISYYHILIGCLGGSECRVCPNLAFIHNDINHIRKLNLIKPAHRAGPLSQVSTTFGHS